VSRLPPAIALRWLLLKRRRPRQRSSAGRFLSAGTTTLVARAMASPASEPHCSTCPFASMAISAARKTVSAPGAGWPGFVRYRLISP
jgi:hypothetical protein